MFAGAAISSDMMTHKTESETVQIKSYAFGPNSISSAPGKEVVWVNKDSSSHTILIDGHESPRLRKGGEYRHTFTKPGEYHYQCGIHKSMKGTVIVAANGRMSGNVSASMSAPTPSPVSKAPTPVPSRVATPSPSPTPSAVKQHIVADGSTISIVDFMRFSPTELTVPAGTEVTWDNHDGSNHIIQFGNVRSPRLRHDASFSYRFDKPGEYPFICAIHGKRMSGKITVN
jgi:plastocyanin